MNMLFALLREALWHSKETLSSDLSERQARKLLRAAEEQMVSGLIIDALIRNDVRMKQQTVFEAFGMLEQIKETSRELNKELQLFAELMKTEDLEMRWS